jgi:hypothetical protein
VVLSVAWSHVIQLLTSIGCQFHGSGTLGFLNWPSMSSSATANDAEAGVMITNNTTIEKIIIERHPRISVAR